jgi:dTDP-4-dehydrorhamnose reductase
VRALVLGARGFVGTSMVDALRARGHDVIGATRGAGGPRGAELVTLDLRDETATLETVAAVGPDVIVHLAAQPDVRKAEEPAERADAAALTATTARVADHCSESGRALVLLSSDYVFDGTSGPYAEDAAPNPLGAYGRAKLATEAAAFRSPRALVVRTSLVYGWPGPGHHGNFVGNLVGAARRGEPTTAYRDVIRTPIYVGHLAGLLTDLIETGATGLYHAGSANAVSMLDLSVQVCDLFGLPGGLVVEAAAGDADPLRPLRCGLEVAKVAATLSRPAATTEEGLRSMKEEELAHV